MKKSILLYQDQKEVFDTLTDEQAGKLIKAIFQYQENGELIIQDSLLKIIMIPIRQAIDRNSDKYDSVCKRNAENIAKRWNKEDTKNTSGIIGKQLNTKNTNSDSDSDSDSNSDNKNDSKKGIKEKNTKNVFTPPTCLEVENYFFESGYKREAGTKAYNYYSIANWQDSKGNKVKNWKQKMQAVWFKDEHKIMIIQSPRQPLVNYGRYVID